jgi:hypothetical protein
MFELKQKIKHELLPSFLNQIRFIKKDTHDRMKLKIAELEDQPFKDVVLTLQKTLTDLYDNHIESYHQRAKVLLFEESGWEN